MSTQLPPGKKPVYVDINQSFTINSYPELLNDEDAVRGSIYNILTTPIGTRAWVPEYGSRLYQFVHEPIDQVTAVQLEVLLIQSLEKWEPRIQIIRDRTKVTPMSDGFNVALTYYIMPSQRISSFEIGVAQ